MRHDHAITGHLRKLVKGVVTFVIWTPVTCVDHVSSELRLENNCLIIIVLLLYINPVLLTIKFCKKNTNIIIAWKSIQYYSYDIV